MARRGAPSCTSETSSRAILSVLEAPREAVHNETFNVGRTEENYRIRELAEIVAETVPGCHVEYAPDGGPDKRCYRINCDKILRVLPGFQPQWTARKGAQELYDAYRAAGLTAEDVDAGRYARISPHPAIAEVRAGWMTPCAGAAQTSHDGRDALGARKTYVEPRRP